MRTITGLFRDSDVYETWRFTRWVYHDQDIAFPGDLRIDAGGFEIERLADGHGAFGRPIRIEVETVRGTRPSQEHLRCVAPPQFESSPEIFDTLLKAGEPRPAILHDIVLSPAYMSDGTCVRFFNDTLMYYESQKCAFTATGDAPLAVTAEIELPTTIDDLLPALEGFATLGADALLVATQDAHAYFAAVEGQSFVDPLSVWEHVTLLNISLHVRDGAPYAVIDCDVDWYDNGMHIAFRNGVDFVRADEGRLN